MQRRARRNHTPAFKAKVALAAIKGDRTLSQLAEQFDVHPNQVTSWKAQLEGGAVQPDHEHDVPGRRQDRLAPPLPMAFSRTRGSRKRFEVRGSSRYFDALCC
jgi:transposase